MIVTRRGRFGQRPNQLFPRPSGYHRFDDLATSIPALWELGEFILQSPVPADYTGFWAFWQPVERRLDTLMRGRGLSDWLIARGGLLRLADDLADTTGGRRYV